MTNEDRWNKILLTLPDKVFFRIMRNYLGNIKTPFNKHDLLKRLASFFKNTESRKRILSLIDQNDALIISAVSFLHEAQERDLLDLLDDELDRIDLHYGVSNLCDRLILYSDPESGVLHINPYLLTCLEKTVISSSILFPSEEITKPQSRHPWLADPLLLTFLSFRSAHELMFKSDTGLRKRQQEEFQAVLPHSLAESRTKQDLLFYALQNSGLIGSGTEANHLPLSRWKKMAQTEKSIRHFLIWAACVSRDRLRIPDYGRFLKALFAAIPQNRSYTEEILLRLVRVLGSHFSLSGIDETFIKRLRNLELILKDGSLRFFINPFVKEISTEGDAGHELSSDGPHAILQPNFELSIKPGIDFRLGLLLSLAGEVRRYDQYIHLEITKNSYSRAISSGYSPKDLHEALSKACEKAVPQNISISLRQWEEELQSVKLFQGTILIADEKKRHIIEHSSMIKPYIQSIPAPGIYLMEGRSLPILRKKLGEAGIEILGEEPGEKNSEEEDIGGPELWTLSGKSPWIRKEQEPSHSPFFRTSEVKPVRHQGPDIRQELLDLLAKEKLKTEEREEIADRIKNKLVLFPRQMIAVGGGYERREAKGIDYLGKIKIIEEAISNGRESLEVIERKTRGGPERMHLRPVRLDKSGSSLLLIGRLLHDHSEVKINVEKISLIRRRQTGLFSP